MKKIIIMAVAAWPFSLAGAQDVNPASLDSMPALLGDNKAEPSAERPERPDSRRILSELSSLRMTARQEERLSASIDKKTKDFDALMAEYTITAVEAKKWNDKLEFHRRELLKITKSVTGIVRSLLDSDQRQDYDALVKAGSKPAPKDPPVAAEKPAVPAGTAATAEQPEDLDGAAVSAEKLPVSAETAAPKAVKKRRVLKKKRGLPAKDQGQPADDSGQPAAAAAAGESGQSPADAAKGASRRSVSKKQRVLRKKAAVLKRAPAPEPEPVAKPAPAPKAAAPAKPVPAEEPVSKAPAGSKPTGQEAPVVEEDAGSYP